MSFWHQVLNLDVRLNDVFPSMHVGSIILTCHFRFYSTF